MIFIKIICSKKKKGLWHSRKKYKLTSQQYVVIKWSNNLKTIIPPNIGNSKLVIKSDMNQVDPALFFYISWLVLRTTGLVAWICLTVDQTVVWGHQKLQKWNNRCTYLTQTYFDFSFKHVSFPWVHKFLYVNFDSLIWFHNSKVGIYPVKTSFSAINMSELVVPVFFT